MSQEIIKKLKKVNGCQYPSCNKKDEVALTMNVYDIEESGNFTPINKLESTCSLCSYHSILAEDKILRLVNQEGMIRLVGPFNIISVCEAVFDAKDFIKAMKKNGKAPKKKKKKVS